VPGILCSGNIVYDILVRPVERIQWGSTAWVEDLERHIGGNGANTAYAAAILGAQVRLLGTVGSDSFGMELLRILSGVQVDVSFVERGAEPTATTVGLVQSGGARAFLHRPGASRQAFVESIDFAPHVSGGFSHYHMANPFNLPSLRSHAGAVLARARAAGLRTSLDTGWDACGEWMRMLEPCLKNIDLLFANEDEGRMLTGKTEPFAMASFLHALGAGTVVLKLGGRGCMVFKGNDVLHVPAFPIDPVDTTGAGDCFAGGFLAGLELGYPIPEAAKLANAAGALSTQKLGATSGLRDLKGTLQWMEGGISN
jgi:sugar/nucleoside kinase (ribokinase family)